jgi:hypothetical protein
MGCLFIDQSPRFESEMELGFILQVAASGIAQTMAPAPSGLW